MARTLNQIKFAYVFSDGSKIEGTRACADEQWDAILAVLLNKPVDFRPSPKQEAIKGQEGASES